MLINARKFENNKLYIVNKILQKDRPQYGPPLKPWSDMDAPKG